MKEHLTVLVGAGGGVEVGLPSTGDLLEVAFDAIRNTQVSKACPTTSRSIVADLEARCHEYFGIQHFNFEHLMHVLEAIYAMRWACQAPGPSPGLATEPMLAAEPHARIAPALDPLFSFCAPQDLIQALHGVISRTSSLLREHPDWLDYASFWRDLEARFELSVGTLNYDSALEQALDIGPEAQGFAPISGETVWRFDERVLRKAPRLMHLHGSIHLGKREYGVNPNRFSFEDDWHDWYWHRTSDAAFRCLNTGVSASEPGHRNQLRGPLITGFDKAEKLLAEPYGSYFRAFADALRENSRLLVVGYGFGDHHVNALLHRIGRYHGGGLRVAVVTKFDPVEMHGSWGPARGNEAGMYRKWGRDEKLLEQMSYSNPLKARSGFLRVYYDGVLSAGRDHLDDMLDFLAG